MASLVSILLIVLLLATLEHECASKFSFDEVEEDGNAHKSGQQREAGPVFEPPLSEDQGSQVAEGQKSYNMMKGQGSMYGTCWINAMASLHTNCKTLDEDKHARLALMFTNCFLAYSDFETYPCRPTDMVKTCLKPMSTHALNSYTHFFTHTQSTCFYLSNQIWQQRTQNTITELSSTSEKVTRELTSLHAMQEETIQNQVALNQDILSSRKNIDEFKEELSRKQDLFMDIFIRVEEIKEFILVGSSKFNTIVFYLTASIAIYLLTTTARTKNARLPLIVLYLANIFIEIKVAEYISHSHDALKSINGRSADIEKRIFWCRSAICGLAFAILTYVAITYKNYAKENSEKLESIDQRISKLEQLQVLALTHTLKMVGNVKLAPFPPAAAKAYSPDADTYDFISDDSDYDEPANSSGLSSPDISDTEISNDEAKTLQQDLSQETNSQVETPIKDKKLSFPTTPTSSQGSGKKYNLRPRANMSWSNAYDWESVGDFARAIAPNLSTVKVTKRKPIKRYEDSPTKKFFSSDDDA